MCFTVFALADGEFIAVRTYAGETVTYTDGRFVVTAAVSA